MKKILKITLSALCVLSMTGCGSKSENNASKKENTKTVEKEEISKSKYFDNFGEDYELCLSRYSINIPEDSYANYSGNCDVFEFDAKNNSKIKVLISTVRLFGDEADDMKLENISNYFEKNNDYYAFIEDSSPMFTIQNENDNKIKKYNVRLVDGNVVARDKNYNFVKVDFWLRSTDNDKNFGKVKDLCEIIVCSDNYEEKNLTNILEELINQIHETE